MEKNNYPMKELYQRKREKKKEKEDMKALQTSASELTKATKGGTESFRRISVEFLLVVSHSNADNET